MRIKWADIVASARRTSEDLAGGDWVKATFTARTLLADLADEIEGHRRVAAAAAGELAIPLPDLFSVEHKILVANAVMRRQRDDARAEVDRLRGIIEDALRYASDDPDGDIEWDTVGETLLNWMKGCEARAEAGR